MDLETNACERLGKLTNVLHWQRLPENLQREAKERQRTSNERQQAIMDYLKEAAESDKPAWQTPDSTPKA